MNYSGMDLTNIVNKDVIDEWMIVGTMLLVSRALTSMATGQPLFTNEWATSSIYTLLGFTVYHIFYRRRNIGRIFIFCY